MTDTARATTIYDRTVPGRGGRGLPRPAADALGDLPETLRRKSAPALPEVDEAEINPLLVKVEGVVGVDALLVLRDGASRHGAAA